MTLLLSSTVCDEIFDHFPLFDETLRHDVHIELCNSVVSEIYSTTNRQNCSKSVLVRRPWFHYILLHNRWSLTVYIHAAPQILLFIIWPMGYNGPFFAGNSNTITDRGRGGPAHTWAPIIYFHSEAFARYVIVSSRQQGYTVYVQHTWLAFNKSIGLYFEISLFYKRNEELTRQAKKPLQNVQHFEGIETKQI